MNSLVYRPCNGVIESGEFWETRQSGNSSTDLFDSMAELNAARSSKDDARYAERDAHRTPTRQSRLAPISREMGSLFNGPCQLHGSSRFLSDEEPPSPGYASTRRPVNPVTGCFAEHCLLNPANECPDVYMALEGLQFMAEHTRREQYTIRVSLPLKKSLYFNSNLFTIIP